MVKEIKRTSKDLLKFGTREEFGTSLIYTSMLKQHGHIKGFWSEITTGNKVAQTRATLQVYFNNNNEANMLI